LFTDGKRTKFPTIPIQYFPPHLKNVAALPAVSKMFKYDTHFLTKQFKNCKL